MKTIQINQADAFTNTIFGGNPAGVVFDADILTTEEMKHIAQEMNLSETAFILNPTQKGANLKLRYFTSGQAEVKFCGHATIGSLYEIGRAGIFGTKNTGSHKLLVETNVGILSMEIVKKTDTDIAIKFAAPNVQLEKYTSQNTEFAKRLDISVSSIDTKHPIMIDKNLNYIYLAIKSLKELGKLQFNFQQILHNFKSENIVVFCLLTPETFESNNNIHARGLAPLVGVPEDPFTGSMQAGLATYVMKNKIMPEITTQIRTEQGHFIGRPGFASIDLPSIHNAPYIIAGKAAHVFSAEISL